MRQWKKLLLASVLLLSALLLLGSVRQPAEPHLLPAEEYRLISPLTYRYLLSPPGPCRDSSPFLVLLVPVAPQQAAARRAVRGTWGGPRGGTLTLFFSGIPAEGLQSPQQRALEEESAQHADIIQMDFMDSYQNLTIKTLMMMGWLGAHCPGAPYAMKVDSDIFLNIFLLLRRLRTASRVGFITGNVISDGRPRRDPSSKWFLSERLFPEERFPPYLSGAAYVFSSDMAPRISWASRFVRPIPLEDVYVGLCLRLLGVRPVYSLSLPLFRNLFQLQKLQYDRCSFSRIIIVNGFQPAELLRIWPDFSAGQAACL